MVTADALSKYGIVAGFENDVKIQVSVGEQNEEITIHEEDHLKMHRMSLKEFGGVVSLNISGVGCVYAKVSETLFKKPEKVVFASFGTTNQIVSLNFFIKG